MTLNYTAELRAALLEEFSYEVEEGDWSPAYVFEHLNAVLTTPLGTRLDDVRVAWADDSVGIDEHTDAHPPLPTTDGRDLERVVFQTQYHGMWHLADEDERPEEPDPDAVHDARVDARLGLT